MKEREIKININAEDMDEVIEKANRIIELLREVQTILNSLFTKNNSET